MPDNEHKTLQPLYMPSEFYKIVSHFDKLDMSSCCDKYGFYIHNKLISLYTEQFQSIQSSNKYVDKYGLRIKNKFIRVRLFHPDINLAHL